MVDDTSVHGAVADAGVVVVFEIVGDLTVKLNHLIIWGHYLRFIVDLIETSFKPQFVFFWWSHSVVERLLRIVVP